MDEMIDVATATWLRSTCAPAASYVLERKAPATLARLEDAKWFRAGETAEVHQLKKVNGVHNTRPPPLPPAPSFPQTPAVTRMAPVDIGCVDVGSIVQPGTVRTSSSCMHRNSALIEVLGLFRVAQWISASIS